MSSEDEMTGHYTILLLVLHTGAELDVTLPPKRDHNDYHNYSNYHFEKKKKHLFCIC